jgi:hypothetical protein
MTAWLASRSMRRLLVAAVCLLAADPLVARILRPAEEARYESDRLFRFENSDFFALGPLVEYLDEHPSGARPRAVFLGNSLVWGYFLAAGETLPARFQELVPGARVLNLGINGLQTGTAYLITKQIIEAVDYVYLFDAGPGANPQLPQLIPVEDADIERFALHPPDRLERWLEQRLAFWHLYRYSYRLQVAFFGTSTRVYAYLHKADIFHALRTGLFGTPTTRGTVAPAEPDARGLVLEAPVATNPPLAARLQALADRHSLLWDYATIVRAHGKHAVIVQTPSTPHPLTQEDRADLNAHFHPHIRFVRMEAPPSLLADPLHLNAAGAGAVAAALRDLTMTLEPGSWR